MDDQTCVGDLEQKGKLIKMIKGRQLFALAPAADGCIRDVHMGSNLGLRIACFPDLEADVC